MTIKPLLFLTVPITLAELTGSRLIPSGHVIVIDRSQQTTKPVSVWNGTKIAGILHDVIRYFKLFLRFKALGILLLNGFMFISQSCRNG